MRCKTCLYCDKTPPNYIIVKILDEDSTSFSYDDLYRQDTSPDRSIFAETAKYLSDLHSDNTVVGYLGTIIVPVTPESFNQIIPHERMLQHLEIFKENLSTDVSEKTLILDVVNRNVDYSQNIIDAINFLLQNPEDPENPFELNYIINLIDTSGSFDFTDFYPSFVNYYNYFSTQENINLVQNTLNDLNDPSTIINVLQFSSDGTISGVGTKHIFIESGELWPAELMYWNYKIAAQLDNNWIENCQKICKHKWTTNNNLYLQIWAPLYNLGSDWQNILNSFFERYISYDDLSADTEVYQYVYNSDHPQRSNDLSANYPERDISIINNRYYDFVGTIFPNSPFKNLIFNFPQILVSQNTQPRRQSGGNCPCYLFDPVKNYIKYSKVGEKINSEPGT